MVGWTSRYDRRVWAYLLMPASRVLDESAHALDVARRGKRLSAR